MHRLTFTDTISCFALSCLMACATGGVITEVSDPPRPKGLVGFSILQGVTDGESTELSVLVENRDKLIYELTDEKTGSNFSPFFTERASRTYSQWSFDKVYFRQLEASHLYRLVIKNLDGIILDSRFLKTYPHSLPHPKVALVSCLDDSMAREQLTQWQEVESTKPDLLLMIGDNFYADRDFGPYKGPVDDVSEWRRGVETRNTLEWYRLKHLIPTVAVWDDHDFGQNDGNREYKFVSQVQANFRDSYAQSLTASKTFEQGPGVSSRLHFFGHTFHLMDGRSFRTPNRLQPPDETHWGTEQERWLFEYLDRKDSGYSTQFLINGTQFFGGYMPTRESYQADQPTSFTKMLSTLAKTKSHVFFISGDAHASELMQIPKSVLGYPTYEITTSGLHALIISRNWIKNKNPYQIEGNDTDLNFALLDFKTARQIKLTVYGPGKKILFSRNLTLP